MSAKLTSHIDNLSQLRLATIKPGDVFLGEMDGVDHEKFFIVPVYRIIEFYVVRFSSIRR